MDVIAIRMTTPLVMGCLPGATGGSGGGVSGQEARCHSGSAAVCSSSSYDSCPSGSLVLGGCGRQKGGLGKSASVEATYGSVSSVFHSKTRLTSLLSRPRSLASSLNALGEEEPTPSPPFTEGRLEIVIDNDIIRRLDLTPAHKVLRQYISRIGDYVSPGERDARELLERTVGFTINYQIPDPLDSRELSEYADIRLWFVRLDAAYPWLPLVLDWRGGELARYSAMLVPHQMSKSMGLVFNPEAIELYTVNKMFVAYTWCKARGIRKPQAKASAMMKVLGFSPDQILFDIIEQSGDPIDDADSELRV